jgi:uncharacterized membrane protein YdbT with pleckstrin-like domain
MSYVTVLLGRNEYVVRVARDHWVTLLVTVLVDLAVSIVIVALSVLGVIVSPPWTWFGFLFLVIPLGHFLHRFWVWWNKQYVVTNRRIIQVTGTVGKRVSDTLLEKINDIVMDQSAMGRLLKFGDIEIIAGSESGIDVFHRIADPIGFEKALLDQKAALGTLDAPAGLGGPSVEASATKDVPAMIADLDELRKKGLLTDAEFGEKKRQLLERI